MKMKRLLTLLLVICFSLSATACSAASAGAETADPPAAVSQSTSGTIDNAQELSQRKPASIDLEGATEIKLSGSSAAISGEGAEHDSGLITISSGGTYLISGELSDGRIIVNAPDEDVTLALNGADISCSYGSPLYVYKARSATVHLVAKTMNSLTDGESYSFDDEFSSEVDTEPNACLYSKQDLLIEGAGSLSVTANYRNGITSKDSLEIYDASIELEALNNGINGKDSNLIDSADITVSCGGDGIISTNDSDTSLGWIQISNSKITVDSGEDAVQAQTSLSLSSSVFKITSGGGSAIAPSSETSAKGIKAAADITISDGMYSLDCSDDAIHSNANISISGGIFAIASGDDGIHADLDLHISAGEIDITNSYEGLEGTSLYISGGNINIVSTDDGINAAGGSDGSGFGGMDTGGWGEIPEQGSTMPEDFAGGDTSTPPEGFAGGDTGTPPEGFAGGDMGTPPEGFAGGDTGTPPEGFAGGDMGTPPEGFAGGDIQSSTSGSTAYTIEISGGSINIIAGGDGMDSNGSIVMTGGTVSVYSSGMADGALDFEGGMAIEGGVLFAATGGGMPAAPSNPTQNTLSLGLSETLKAGQLLTFSCGDAEYSFSLAGNATSIAFSAPELQEGDVCSISADGDELLEITVTEGLTSSGSSGAFGGMNGGGWGGGNRGGNRGGDMQQPGGNA